MEIRRGEAEVMRKEAQAKLLELFNERKDGPILFMSSGGSNLTLLEGIQTPEFTKIAVTVLDERYTFETEANNFTNLSKTSFMKDIIKQGGQIIDSRPQGGESLEDSALSFEQELKVWRVRNPKGKIIATIGSGREGHVGGVFPYPNDKKTFEKTFFNPEIWVFGYDAPASLTPYQSRITTILSFIRNEIDASIVFVIGEEKRETVENIQKEKGTLHEWPARIVRETQNTFLFTDVLD